MQTKWNRLSDAEKRRIAPSPNSQHCWDDHAYCSIAHPKGTPHQVDHHAAMNALALGDEEAAGRIMGVGH